MGSTDIVSSRPLGQFGATVRKGELVPGRSRPSYIHEPLFSMQANQSQNPARTNAELRPEISQVISCIVSSIIFTLLVKWQQPLTVHQGLYMLSGTAFVVLGISMKEVSASF